MGGNSYFVDTPTAAERTATETATGTRPALPTIDGELVDPEELAAEVEPLDAEQAIAWAIDRFGATSGSRSRFRRRAR